MTTAAITITFALLMIMITKVPVAVAMARQPGGYDNRYPRDQQSKLQGFGQRALAAHHNSLEAFPVISAAVIVAALANISTSWLDIACAVIVTARLLYTAFYWADIHLLRSIAWTGGFLSCLALLIIAAI